MAEYKTIKGFTVQNLSADPASSGLAGGVLASMFINPGRKPRLWLREDMIHLQAL